MIMATLDRTQVFGSGENFNVIAADKVEGTSVYDMAGDKLGSIRTVMIDKISGKVVYATLAFGGGVLHNRLLKARLSRYLADYTLLFPQRFPAGDGAIALGQGVIAAARCLAQG